jgi:hypothetical protein
VLAGEALVGDHGVALELDAAQQLGGDLALGEVGRRELAADRHPVGCAQEVEPEAPEVARVRGAVAVAGKPANSERLTVSRDWPTCTGVESKSLPLSHHERERNAIAFSNLTICGASARMRLL